MTRDRMPATGAMAWTNLHQATDIVDAPLFQGVYDYSVASA